MKEKFKDIPIETTFQSRFGPEEWLTPYTDKTLEEIAIQGKESFIENGGENYDVVPCLNDNDDHIKMMEHIVKKYLIN